MQVGISMLEIMPGFEPMTGRGVVRFRFNGHLLELSPEAVRQVLASLEEAATMAEYTTLLYQFVCHNLGAENAGTFIAEWVRWRGEAAMAEGPKSVPIATPFRPSNN